MFEIVMVTYRKMSYQFSASSRCLLHMFRCKFIVLFYDNVARKNLKIAYNNKSRIIEIFYIRTHKQQNNRADL